jgi:hypothetical protein
MDLSQSIITSVRNFREGFPGRNDAGFIFGKSDPAVQGKPTGAHLI